MSDKYSKLDDLINEYYELVKKYPDCLPPYATFKTYLVDDGNCCNDGHKCVDRPQKIKELVDKLETENDEEKLEAILELWSHGGEIKVGNKIFNENSTDKLLHSADQKGKIQTAIEDFNKENILIFTEFLSKYIKHIEANNNEIDIENNEFYTYERLSGIIRNKVNAPLNELLFWYFYDQDKYPLINSRAKNSRHILNRSFPKDKTSNDLEFNKRCMEILKDKELPKVEKKNITKQLMLDQLFYSIDEMKSMKEVEKKYKDKNGDIYKFYQKLWNTIKGAKRVMQTKDLNLFKNIIYHGAPGTGKTYELKAEIKEHLDLFEKGESEFIQFHSAYSYEDFIGGLKPTSGTTLNLKYKNGIFKELCRKAAQYEIAYYSHVDWDKKILTDESKVEKEMTLKIDKKDFKLNTKEPILSQFPPFFILIDEINRADLSKVFGELLYAIEDGYRGFENKFKLSNSYMETKDTAVHWENDEAYFFVPKNMYIRGTMNDIDRSIDSIDFAFRRRFKWVEKKYVGDKIKEILSISDDSLSNYIQSCNRLNKLIEKIQIADESYFIGHAIFSNIIKYIEDGDIKNINKESKTKLFDNHIEPIIYNYLKMDYGNESSDIKTFREVFVQ